MDLNHKKDILQIYKNSSFTDLYGGSIIFSLLSAILLSYIIYVIVSQYFINYIEENWNDLKCTPPYNMFAGIIHNHNDKTFSQKIKENQNQCMKNVFHETTKGFEEPLKHASRNLEASQVRSDGHLDDMQENIHRDSKETHSFFEHIQNIMKLTALYSQKSIATLKDSIHKLAAVLTSSINVVSIIGGMFWKAIYFFKQLLVLIRNYTIGVITGLSLLIIVFVFSFNWIAAGVTGTFLALTTVFLTMIMLFIPTIVNTIDTANMQMNSACFHGETKIKTKQGISVKIKDLQVGDVLEDNSIVTSTMKIPYHDSYTMVNIDGIIVTSDHRIVYKNGLISCDCHPNNKPLVNFSTDYLYCINTNLKTISVKNYTFLDWDDLSHDEYIFIQENVREKTNVNVSIDSFFERGFDENTDIECITETKKLYQLRIGDETARNEHILCIVDVLHSINGEKRKHVITSTGTFTINSHVYLDFDKEKEYYLYLNIDNEEHNMADYNSTS